MERIYDVIIIGGGPAGLSAGIYAGRAKLDVLLLEKAVPGGQIRITDEVVNYPGILETTGAGFGEKAAEQAKKFGVQFATEEVIGMDFSGKIKTIKTTSGEYKTLAVVIATGASPRKLGFPGELEYGGRGVAYCATCDGEFFTGLPVFVVGAGFAAAEEAMFLTKYASKVTVIAREPDFTCAKSIGDKVKAHPKIEVKFHTELVEATGDTQLRHAKFKNNETGEITEYHAADGDTFGIFVFVGYAPETQLFKGVIDLDPAGFIPTDEDLMTNVEGVYAAGDIRPKKLRQVVTAVADGAIAATNIERYVQELREELGIVKEEKEEEKRTETASSSRVLDEGIMQQIQGLAERFEKSVKLVVIQDPEKPEKSEEMLSLVKEIASASDKIQVQQYQKGENPEMEAKIQANFLPVVAFLNDKGEYARIKYAVVPGGHELTSFLLALYNVAGPGQAVNEEITKKSAQIEKGVNLKIGVSLTCTKCPETVQSAQRIAVENPNVDIEVVDVFGFQDFKKKYDIMSVPAVVMNDKDLFFGQKDIPALLDDIFEKLEK
ncbi:FAD-dependent oxidoreductase [Fusobacterium necrophorum]|uniref:FAD-dependent oxidoreductase n=1 Tax=Fusobacterium necrophorum TaxID=859 RepID=UPI000245D880|nr:FAD-dependent oxidoreductase [Fusobacterium necrophorum]EHO21122.1 thioredoxin-disulfide reductase [Fusobacterium necrophorum subsp. funduliforme 1_1_36S]AVQ20750.1 FAD-binding protein [Fusobacterium necrophorum subsp. funduliforme]MDK4472820.1 FAD-dependent oxidoreductase [Fusobacterium necrophorum]MDK4478051.1 FAD-dependent oxidoreductase [Fusobacterium necrophorum]MDK4509677.1 FAD-dependent oxidoreductase [Fusobacterium necrophorum]